MKTTMSMKARRLALMLAVAAVAIFNCAIPVSAACDVQTQVDATSYTVTEVKPPHNYAPSNGAAIYRDEFGNVITANNDGFQYVLDLSTAFSVDENGNIIGASGNILATAPFMVGKNAKDGTITLVDANGIAVYFHLEDGKAQFDFALAPAVYMDEFGRIVSVDYFGRETFLTPGIINKEAR